MRPIVTEDEVRVPDGVVLCVQGKKIEVCGPKGRNERNFKDARVEFEVGEEGRVLHVRCWLGDRAARAMVPTVCSHIRNMVNGVLAGYEVCTRQVFQHFPIHQTIEAGCRASIISNFMGKKDRVLVKMPEGVELAQPAQERINTRGRPTNEKVIKGVDLEKVTQAAASFRYNKKLRPGDKDPVKFRDGVYRVSVEFADKEVLGVDSPSKIFK